MSILWVFESDVSVVQKGLFAIYNVKNRFSLLIFTIYDMGIPGVTRGYRGLKGVTRGDRGLQGVTRGYKGLQVVTRGDSGLLGVTKDYRIFFLTRTFPDTFSWSILHKKSKLKKCQIFDLNDGLTPLEKF